MINVSSSDFRKDFARVLDSVLGGALFRVTRNGRAVAYLLTPASRRECSRCEGVFWITPVHLKVSNCAYCGAPQDEVAGRV